MTTALAVPIGWDRIQIKVMRKKTLEFEDSSKEK